MKFAIIAFFSVLSSTSAFASAEAVEYMKVCSLYGVGYHYIPGTDTCLQAATGITKKETEYGTLEGQSQLAKRVKELEAKVDRLNKYLGIED